MTETATAPATDLVPRLKLSRWVAAESVGADEVVIFHSVTQARLKIRRGLYDLLQRFSEPRTLSEAFEEAPPAAAREAIQRLLDKGFLVDLEENPRDLAPEGARLLARSRETLFKCPPQRLEEAEADVLVFGAPTDAGTRTIPGMRLAPEQIRQRSGDFDYRLSVDSGRPLGWFEVDQGRQILAGVTFGDLGNVVTTAGEPLADLFARVEAVAAATLDRGALPVLLGGDHSVSYPTIRAAQAREPISVLYLDAHGDADPTIPPSVVNHSCLALRLRRLPGVSRLVQVGHRGFALRDKAAEAPPGVEIIPLRRWREEGVEGVLRALPEDLPCYVTVDVNVLDPVVAPGTSQPSPGGMTLEELKEVVRTVGLRRRVVGFDLTEVNPSRDTGFITAIIACHVLLSGLGGVFAGRSG